MKFFLISLIFLLFNITSSSSSELEDCSIYSKLSSMFYKCKSNNFVKDTKNYQKKEWSEEKNKINKIKEKVLD